MTDIAIATPSAPATPATGGGDDTPIIAGWPQRSAGAVREYMPDAVNAEGEQSAEGSDAAEPAEAAPPVDDEFWSPDENVAGKKIKLKFEGVEKTIQGSELIKYAQLGLLATKATQTSSRLQDQLTMVEQTLSDPRAFFERALEGGDGESAMLWIQQLARHAWEHQQQTPDQRRLSQYERNERARVEQERHTQAETRQREVTTNWAQILKLSGIEDNAMGHAIAAEMRDIQGRRIAANERLYSPEQMAAYAKRRTDEMMGVARLKLTPEQRRELVRPEDVQAQARAQIQRQTIPSAPAATPPRNPANGQFQQGNKARMYDPFG